MKKFNILSIILLLVISVYAQDFPMTAENAPRLGIGEYPEVPEAVEKAPADPNAKIEPLDEEEADFAKELIGELKKGRYKERLEAANDLQDLGISVGPYLEKYLKAEDFRVRRSILNIFASVGYAKNMREIIEMYKNEKEASVREAAFNALVAFNGPASEFFIKDITSVNEERNKLAHEALLKTWFNARSHIDKIYEETEDKELKGELEKLYQKKAFGIIFGLVNPWSEESAGVLAQTTQKAARQMQPPERHAYWKKQVDSLGKHGYKSFLRFLESDKFCFEWFRNGEQCYQIRAGVLEILGNLDNPESLQLIIDNAKDSNPKIRVAVLMALLEKRDKSSVPVLLNFVNDDSQDVIFQYIVTKFFFQQMELIDKNEDLLADLIAKMKDQERPVKNRNAIASGVAKIVSYIMKNKNSSQKNPLLSTLEDSASSYDKELLQAYMGMLNEKNSEIVEGALNGLSLYQTAEVNNAIHEMVKLGKVSPKLRIVGLKMLGDRKVTSAKDTYVKLLSDINVDVILQSVVCLVQINAQDEASKLQALIKRDNWQIRQYCVWAVGRLQYYSALPDIFSALKDDNIDVAYQSLLCLADLAAPALPPDTKFDLLSKDELESDRSDAIERIDTWWKTKILPKLKEKGLIK